MNDNYFVELNNINVNDHTDKKNNLTYLSWAWAWQEVKKLHPDANYKVYEREDGRIYWDDGRTAWVKTGVTINNIEHIEYLPIMDFRNQSINIDKITSFDVNKSIQRSLTKAVARHGLGLYIYAGEDLPEEDASAEEFKKDAVAAKTAQTRAINKAKAAGAEDYTPPAPKKPLAERYQTCLAWLKSQTSETFKNASKSHIDGTNQLLKDLHEAGSAGWEDTLMAEYNRVTSIDDSIPY